MTVEIRRMWEDGPLRQWADKSHGTGWNYYENRQMVGYAGPYVCDKCSNGVVGVYSMKNGKWFCAACKDGKTPEKRVLTENQLAALANARLERIRRKARQ